ncbi:helix-turn-helix transcriptional regulator [Streptomyces olivoreticuli]
MRLGRLIRSLRGDRPQSSVSTLAWSEAKISRIESGRIGISEGDLDRLLDLYEIKDRSLRRHTHELRVKGGQQGWESSSSLKGILSPEYTSFIGFEADASEMFTAEPVVVPGLLQIEEYTRAMIQELEDEPGEDEIKQRAAVRTKRQEVFLKSDPLRFRGVMSESALTHEIGGADVLLTQLEYLIGLDRRFGSRVQLHVLPERSSAHAAIYSGSFAILRFPERWEPDVVYLDGLTGMRYLEKEDETGAYTKAFQDLLAEALSKEESNRLIQHHIDKLKQRRNGQPYI